MTHASPARHYVEPERPGAAAGQALRPALFLDRDGVINVNHGYVHTPEQTQWLPGIFDLCRDARAAGFAIVVVTNQAGIARGLYSEDQFLEYTRWVHGQFRHEGAALEATFYCPHHPEAGVGEGLLDCDCRKPKPGMLLAAAQLLRLDLAKSLLLGDAESDLQAAASAGVGRAFLLGRDLQSPAELPALAGWKSFA